MQVPHGNEHEDKERELLNMSVHEKMRQGPGRLFGRRRLSKFERVLEEGKDAGKVWHLIQKLLELRK